MTSRRSFVSALSATLGSAVLRGIRDVRNGSVTVDATVTIFRAQPDGRSSLVRFAARRVDAPAGRLRVYDRERRLIGTAGMIQSGDGLYGELWFPVDRATRITTELESPGVRGVVRTTHRLRPARRWTIYWLTVADPRRIARQLEELPPIRRGLQRAIYAAQGVTGNPIAQHEPLELMDHLAFLRTAEEALALEARYGIPVSKVAVSTGKSVPPAAIALALAGSGVRYVTRSGIEYAPLEWLEARDGSRVLLIALPPGADPHSLGFTTTGDEMTRRVERWLMTHPHPLSPALAQSGGRAVVTHDHATEAAAVILDTECCEDGTAIPAAVQAWNSRFAYPRIVGDIPAGLATSLRASPGTSIPVARSASAHGFSVPSATELALLAEQREAARTMRVAQMVAPLAHLLGARAQDLAAIRAEIAATRPGTLVFNPSPFPRTDVAIMPDGSEKVVTDVPGLGYAFVVDRADRGDRGDRGHRGDSETAAPTAPSAPESLTIETTQYRLTLDRGSGAITSLVSLSDGIEWVRPDSDGLCAVTGAILEELSREALPGVGVRLTARRWSRARGEVQTRVTIYDALPWVDIENDAQAVGTRAMQYLLPFALSRPKVAWEVPAGYEEQPAPVERAVHLRWLKLTTEARTLLFRGIDAPFVSVLDDGALVSFGPRGRARYRLSVAAHDRGVWPATRFGWDAEPFVTRRVSAPGSGRLPRFAALLELDQPRIAIIALKPADDGNGVIVYLQELAGVGGLVSVGAGLLRFETARVVDYLERDTEESIIPVPEGVAVRLRAWGIVALRLLEVKLRGG